ncbi:hypothetical protein F4821DRAFT_260352 [Hypoxylon rubiginosum]|uniref:Uncharacterized protein n=1 Tax=Hypoxylon rubiginosum TaxID=110542 RepID=A0ACC0D010_9PEZI|nr:hypothetical protein F4821DRAFT_260352 [Hypoxylon rubiginosum]
MTDLAPLDGLMAKTLFQSHQPEINKYLHRRVNYFERTGCFVCQSSAKGAVLVIILSENCPYRPGPYMTNERVEEHVDDALLGNYHPFPEAPHYNLYSVFANAVVVKLDDTARSGYAPVSWPTTIISPRGEFGDEEHRERLILPEVPKGQEELETGPLPVDEDDEDEENEDKEDEEDEDEEYEDEEDEYEEDEEEGEEEEEKEKQE